VSDHTDLRLTLWALNDAVQRWIGAVGATAVDQQGRVDSAELDGRHFALWVEDVDLAHRTVRINKA
jgi:hypothetical protein